MNLLFFKPILKTRVWGGNALATKFGRVLPKDTPIGESWELVDRDEDQSILVNGPHSGLSLRALLKQFGREILGPSFKPGQPFPLLIKWLDCQDTLSVQVHPKKNKAETPGSQPKTENWYVVDKQKDAKLYVGLKSGVQPEELAQAANTTAIESMINMIPTKVGDSFLIRSGMVHAIGAGHLILEIQENSDTTYRLYDWNRLGLDGNPRDLHLNEALQSIDYDLPAVAPCIESKGATILAKSEHFRITEYKLNPSDAPLELRSSEGAKLLHLVEGSIEDAHSDQKLIIGDTALQVYDKTLSLLAREPSTLIVTDEF
tara:strand:- start:1556 stop:2503 length:948 start_codon:yes stop_codon:yes gene_type:complete